MAAPAIAPASEAEAGVAAIALAIARTTIEPVMILLLSYVRCQPHKSKLHLSAPKCGINSV
jgi:hypothetical protein